jgi:hypothetical protein
VRRSVDTNCRQHACCPRSLGRLFSDRRSLGPYPAGRSGRCARYARAWRLVDRCPAIRKETDDSLIEKTASHARWQLSDRFSGRLRGVVETKIISALRGRGRLVFAHVPLIPDHLRKAGARDAVEGNSLFFLSLVLLVLLVKGQRVCSRGRRSSSHLRPPAWQAGELAKPAIAIAISLHQ